MCVETAVVSNLHGTFIIMNLAQNVLLVLSKCVYNLGPPFLGVKFLVVKWHKLNIGRKKNRLRYACVNFMSRLDWAFYSVK